MRQRLLLVGDQARRSRRFLLLAVGLLLLSLVPAAPLTSSARAQTVPFTPAPCPVQAPEGLQLDCGYLTVAESRRNYTGKTIQLAVGILRSPNPNKAADPAVFLQGGPGGATLALVPAVAGAYAPILARRDIIFMDQRGTGFSRPNLNCDFSATRMLDGWLPFGGIQQSERPDFLQLQVDVFSACGQAYRQQGVDLSAYNSVENAADFEDLRLALGYGPWNIMGFSYGTRLALTMMRYRPETIRSVLLDSVYSPQLRSFNVTAIESYNRALNVMFADCAADPACNAAFPDLGASFDTLVARLNANPVQLPLVNPDTGEVLTYIPFTGVDFSTLTFQLMYITPIIPILPALISLTENSNYELLSLITSLLFSDPSASLSSIGMQIAVQCNEDTTFNTPEEFVQARDTNRRASSLANIVTFNEAILEVCGAFGLTNPDPAENTAVSSDLPTFIIAGAYDPITPPENARNAASTLPNSFVVEYPRGGHTPSLYSPCLTNAVAAFLDNPAQAPDTSCIAGEAPLPFLAPQNISSLNTFRLR